MRVLDLFAGLGGWSNCWRRAGHDVFTVDLSHAFDVDWHRNVMRLEPREIPWQPDVILASPPCEAFSVLTIGKHWTHPPENAPKTKQARTAVQLVERTLWLIRELQPEFYIIENRRGKLRALSLLKHLERRTVTYCQYGLSVMKPTDLWGVFPPSLELRPTCRNGDPCHRRSPRGSKNGIHNGDDYRTAAARAVIPPMLAYHVMKACERDAPQRDTPGYCRLADLCGAAAQHFPA